MAVMQDELEILRKKAHAKNITLHGLEDTPDVNKKLLESSLNTLQLINVDIRKEHIESAHRIGRTPGRRPFIIELISESWMFSL